MKISDLIISPKSLGDKLWLVDVSPAYEYKETEMFDEAKKIGKDGYYFWKTDEFKNKRSNDRLYS